VRADELNQNHPGARRDPNGKRAPDVSIDGSINRKDDSGATIEPRRGDRSTLAKWWSDLKISVRVARGTAWKWFGRLAKLAALVFLIGVLAMFVVAFTAIGPSLSGLNLGVSGGSQPEPVPTTGAAVSFDVSEPSEPGVGQSVIRNETVRELNALRSERGLSEVSLHLGASDIARLHSISLKKSGGLDPNDGMDIPERLELNGVGSSCQIAMGAGDVAQGGAYLSQFWIDEDMITNSSRAPNTIYSSEGIAEYLVYENRWAEKNDPRYEYDWMVSDRVDSIGVGVAFDGDRVYGTVVFC
jgi:hypothetical protein